MKEQSIWAPKGVQKSLKENSRKLSRKFVFIHSIFNKIKLRKIQELISSGLSCIRLYNDITFSNISRKRG